MRIAVIGGNEFALANAFYLRSRQHDVTWVCEHQEVKDEFDSGEMNIDDYSMRGVYAREDFPLITSVTANYEEFDLLVLCQSYRLFTDGTGILDHLLKAIAESKSPARLVIRSDVPPTYLALRFGNDPIVVYMPRIADTEDPFHDLVTHRRLIFGGQRAVSEVVATAYEAKSASYLTLEEAALAKLAVNTHLAMRVSFFNELEEVCKRYGQNAANVIECVTGDERIGAAYSNPSFGFSGALHQFATMFSQSDSLPLMASITKSNHVRAHQIVDRVMNLLGTKLSSVLIYRIKDKENDTFESSSLHIAQIMCELYPEIPLTVYEPDMVLPEWFTGFHQRTFDAGDVDSKCLVLANRADDVIDYITSMGIAVVTCDKDAVVPFQLVAQLAATTEVEAPEEEPKKEE